MNKIKKIDWQMKDQLTSLSFYFHGKEVKP